ncbi:MAG TPA: protein kinase, partial [Pyrinomonadaceae bacterium]|nr:protein kinase [Pyrinomonadaceae bacterium]
LNEADFYKIKEIFAETVELPKERREAVLREKCGADEELYTEVNSLLAAHDEAENIIEKNAFSFDSFTNSNGRSYDGKQFGNYRILREIGHGGMGAVFLATRNDGEFNQKVALKIVRQTILDTETERHFRREREILAGLNHPNIAHLHDGGVSASGEAFLAMEYVEGENLLEFAESQKLSIEAKLKLFLKICAAVSYAHRNLTIHRDLKPSNILVNKDGEPKLLDFGLAKILDENLSDQNQTTTVFRAFTPAYASPEQILGRKVTTASDVYSLGVVFYELLAGDKPFHFEGKSLEEIINTITNFEPLAPSAVPSSRFQVPSSIKTNPKSQIRNPKLKGDLDNIALKAIQKEPERRYQSVAELASDIERHLKGLPILARPATISYRASKFFKRNKIAVSAAAIVVLSILTGLFFTLWQANETRRERDRAEKRFNEVRKLSNSILSDITPKIERLQGSTEARQILVKNALEYLDSLAVESKNDAELQSELASAYEKIGDLQGNPQKPNLNDYYGAIESYRKAQTIRQNLPPTPENQRLSAQNYRQLSNSEFAVYNIKDALESSAQALNIYQNLLAENSQSLDLNIEYIDTEIENAAIYSSNNQFRTAIPLFQSSLENLAKLDQNNRETNRLTAKTLGSLANAHSWNDQQTEAETEVEKARVLIDELGKKYPNDPIVQTTAFQIYGFAASINEGIKNDVSLKYALKFLQIAADAVENDSADLKAKYNLARAYSRVGISYVNVKQIPKAIENLQKAEEIITQLVERDPKNLLFKRDLAKLYVRFGDAETLEKLYPEAAASYQKSADLFENIAQTDDKNTLAQRDLAQSLKSVGETFLKLGENEKAKQSYEKASAILQDLIDRNALGDYDRKMFDDVQKALQKL